MTGSQCIPVASIEPSPLNPRREFDPEKLSELAASMKEHGLLHPIAVYPWEDGYRVLVGERRFLAAAKLGWDMMPATIWEYPTEQEALLMALVENIQREPLNPIEEAEQFLHLYRNGMPQSEIAAKIGRTQGFVSNRMRLLRLPDEVQAMFRDGSLSAKWGAPLLWYEAYPEVLVKKAKEAADPESGLKVADLEQDAKRGVGGKGGEVVTKSDMNPDGAARCRECGYWFAIDDMAGGCCSICHSVPYDADAIHIPRPTMEEWEAKRRAQIADLHARRHERKAYAEDLMQAMAGPLTSVRPTHDCRRLALICYDVLNRIPFDVLSAILPASGLEHLLPYFDGFVDTPVEEAWEALAALDPESLVTLPADALLAAAVARYEEGGEDPKEAKWYAEVEVTT